MQYYGKNVTWKSNVLQDCIIRVSKLLYESLCLDIDVSLMPAMNCPSSGPITHRLNRSRSLNNKTTLYILLSYNVIIMLSYTFTSKGKIFTVTFNWSHSLIIITEATLCYIMLLSYGFFRFSPTEYCLSKKYWPIFIVYLLNQNWGDF